MKRALLLMSRLLIGHGVGLKFLLRPLGYVFGLTLLGMGVIALDQWAGAAACPDEFCASQGVLQSTSWFWRFFASLDQLLPVVALDKEFTDLIPKTLHSTWAKAYFWALGIFGWVLATFVLYALGNAMRRD